MDKIQIENEIAEFRELLDEVGIDFALHTHHPLTHMELDNVDALDINTRVTNCLSPL